MEMEKLVGSADAKLWAQAFMEFVELLPNLVKDEEMLTGWFANAIMSGYDLGHKAGQRWAWIPVDEKQPKDLECTLVVLHGKKAFLYYGGEDSIGHYWLDENDNVHKFYPSHWADTPPLPEVK